MPMSNVKAALIIASAHGSKMLMAVIDKSKFEATAKDETKAIDITEKLRAADAIAAKLFVDPNDDAPGTK